MTALRILRAAALFAGLGLLGGCAAVSAVQTAASPLDSFELTPLAPGGSGASGPLLRVELPTTSGTLASDRIAIKPSALQVQYLPGVRWVDEANIHVQMLMMRSLSGTGRFALVSGDGPAPLPDFVLLSDLRAFQAELVVPEGGDPAAPVAVAVVRLDASILDDRDDTLRASGRFEARVPARGSDPVALVAAMDAAMTEVLREVTAWGVANTR